ncbi:hypothetical protein CLV56_0638 [Mumia flava]|uniref:DUF7144 domain-containing protein n=1 Tax=Mumia flava TaxID=1348852 RepID=A0A0B2BG91_9ACTN|nr:hypothetical protein [Mumia flava]PJJ56430.1 hypothetical protein CLV56_0638 [Mumia flava]
MATRSNPVAQGVTLFATALLLMLGIVQIFTGIAGIAKDDLLVATPDYIYALSTTAWGWIHLILGIIFVVVAIMIVTGSTFARIVGIGIAVLSLIANFLWLPYYPFWAFLVIAFDVLVIWALSRYTVDD